MLYLTQEARRQIIEDSVKTFPDECCGFLLGHEKKENRTVEKIIVVTNVKEGDKRRRFKISAADYLRAEQYADENNLILLGVYHSHPNHPSAPSEHDRVVAQPYFSYIIVSVQERKFATLQSWRLNEDLRFEEELVGESIQNTISKKENLVGESTNQ